jgi:hypothetical protein
VKDPRTDPITLKSIISLALSRLLQLLIRPLLLFHLFDHRLAFRARRLNPRPAILDVGISFLIIFLPEILGNIRKVVTSSFIPVPAPRANFPPRKSLRTPSIAIPHDDARSRSPRGAPRATRGWYSSEESASDGRSPLTWGWAVPGALAIGRLEKLKRFVHSSFLHGIPKHGDTLNTTFGGSFAESAQRPTACKAARPKLVGGQAGKFRAAAFQKHSAAATLHSLTSRA